MRHAIHKLIYRPTLLAAARCYAAPLDLNHPDANMYGCFTCPVCKSIYRWPTQQGTVRCDDCGLVQELEKTDMAVRLGIMADIKSGKITLAQGQAELAAIQRQAKKLGLPTAYGQ